MAEDLVKEAREALDLSYQFDKDNRKEAIEDLRFVAGFQWSDSARQERQGRPLITINRSGQFIRQVANPIRQNMPTIKVEPDGDDQQDMAEIVNGLFRRIQYNSSASHVYANATEHMVACGIGWWRICQDYTDDNSFNQEIKIKRVFNPLSVYPDPSALEPDRSDMNWCLVSELWPIEAFKQKWPNKAATSLDAPNNGSAQQAISWGSSDTVRVAEYFRKKVGKKSISQLSTGHVIDSKHLDGPMGEQIKPHVVGQRDVDDPRVEMMLMSGAEQLEETFEVPCRWIPVVPVIGAEIPIEQGTYRHGLIRFQREPQQVSNYLVSVLMETMGQQPKSPYLVTTKQIGPYKSLWDNANRVPTPYLPYVADPDVPGGQPTRLQPPPVQAALVQAIEMMDENQKATTGQYDASLGARSNETSGVAIGQRVQQGDESSAHFVDNLQHGLEHTGRIILDMIPKVYDTQRTMKIKGEGAAKEKTVTLNKPVINYDGQDQVHNDMSTMSFNAVRVILGQNFASRKQQTSQTLIGLLQAMPQLGQIAGDIIAKNLDIDQADELAERLHLLLPPQILQAEQQANQPGGQQGQPPPGPPPPSPEQQAQQQQMQQQQQVHEQAMQLEQQAGQFKVQAESAKAAAANQAVQTEQAKTRKAYLDGQLVLKKLSEPPPDPQGDRTASAN